MMKCILKRTSLWCLVTITQRTLKNTSISCRRRSRAPCRFGALSRAGLPEQLQGVSSFLCLHSCWKSAQNLTCPAQQLPWLQCAGTGGASAPTCMWLLLKTCSTHTGSPKSTPENQFRALSEIINPEQGWLCIDTSALSKWVWMTPGVQVGPPFQYLHLCLLWESQIRQRKSKWCY